LEEENKTFVSEGEPMTLRAFIFGAGKIERDKKAIVKQGH